jgi:carboxylesterase
MMIGKDKLINPFYLAGGDPGLLLVHGFTACPVDMKPLGKKLNSFGYTVSAPLLAGHGLTPEELLKTNWDDWVESTLQACLALKEKRNQVVAIGHSMGGLLALWLAVRGLVAGVVSINAPVIYQDPNLHLAERLLGIQEFAAKPYKESEISHTKEGLPHFSYLKVPVACFVSLNKAITLVQNELPKIACPALIVQSLGDKTVNPRSGGIIEAGINHRQKEMVYWEGEDHYLPLSPARDRLAEKIKNFLGKYNL